MTRARHPFQVHRSTQVRPVPGTAGPSDPPRFADAAAAGVVLLVGGGPLALGALQRMLHLDGHRARLAATASEVEEGLAEVDLAVVLIDLETKVLSGLELLNRIVLERPELAAVVVTGRISADNAIGVLRRGAFDYLARSFEDPQRVRIVVQRALEHARLLRRNRELESALARTRAPGRVADAWPSPADAARGRAASEALNDLPLTLEAYEKSALERALREVGGDARAAACALGMGRSTLYRKLARYGLRAGKSANRGARRGARELGAGGPIG